MTPCYLVPLPKIEEARAAQVLARHGNLSHARAAIADLLDRTMGARVAGIKEPIMRAVDLIDVPD
jgi:hypothetical protein